MTTSALTNYPSNRNFLSPLNYKVAIKRCPGVDFFVQKINIPSISTTPTVRTTPLNKIPIPGDELNFEPLNITFMVDEELRNWYEIQTWMRQLAFPENTEQYNTLASQTNLSGYGVKSDISCVILNSAKNPLATVTFSDAFPIKLGPLDFDSNLTDVTNIKSTATFVYTLYDIDYNV